jgi:hypothetical protein
MNVAMDPLRNQRIHLEAGLIKVKHQLGISSAGVEHDVTEGPHRNG